MNIRIWEWWAKQTPTNKLITGLAIALCVVWGVREKDLSSSIASANTHVSDLTKANGVLNERIVSCEKENADKRITDYQTQLKEAKEEKRKSDSMYYVITAAQKAVKAAIKNETK